MAITGQSPLTDVLTAKELEIGYQPVLLARFSFVLNTITLNLSSENMSVLYGGMQYNGVDYLPRILNQGIDSTQEISDNGIVQSPSLTLELADADKYLWTNFELQYGFKGATLQLILVFWDPGTATFSTDSRVMFNGICNPAESTPTQLNVTATSLLNVTRTFLPTVAISQLCPWTFPAAHADRVAGALNADSIFYQCGYSPDVTDADGAGGTAAAVGNLNGTAPYTDCGKGWSDCIARLGNSAAPTTSTSGSVLVQIQADTSGRHTARFGGIRYSPPGAWSGKAYISGTSAQGINDPNTNKYTNGYFPMLYGTAMVTCPVMNVLGDPNSTRFEVVICVGQVDTVAGPGPVQAVLVNGLYVPHITQTNDSLMAWFWVANGARGGAVNLLPPYNGQGDPYGSLATICVVVYASVQGSNSLPTVQVLTNGPALRQYPGGTVASEINAFTNNPVWCVADMLTWGNFATTDLDLASFAAEAAYAAQSISYTGLNGTAGTHARYQLGLALTERRSLSDVLKTVLASFDAILRPSLIDGTLQIVIKKSFANQQPAPIPGSNNQSAFGGGYSAYDFSESSIKLTDGSGFEDTARVPTLSFSQRVITDTPNRLTLAYQDQDYNYNTDVLIMIDSGDITRAGGQMIAGNVAAEGILNYDQATRIIQTMFAEGYRGNPRAGTSTFNGQVQNDSGGTYIAKFDSTFKALHLRCGDLIRISFGMYGLSTQPFRITAIKPAMNYEAAQIVANWHSDSWYTDSYGQAPAPTPSAHASTPGRPPYAWCPNTVGPTAGDALYAASDLTFSLGQSYAASSNGSITASLAVAGLLPANSLSGVAPPVFGGSTFGSGSIPAGTYFFAGSAIDTNGYESALSLPPYANVTLTSAGGVNLAITWNAGTVGYKIFGGSDLYRMSLQASGSGTPGSLGIGSLNVATEGAPDQLFDHLTLAATKVWQPGLFYAPVASVSGSTVTFSTAATLGNLAGYVLSLLGSANSSGNIPVVDALISASGANSITVSGVNLTGVVNVGDVVCVRATGAVVTATSISDPNFANVLPTPEPPIAVQTISNASPIVVTSKVPHGYATGDQVLVSLLYGAPLSINGSQYTITVTDSLNFSLNGSAAAGLYAGGGITQRLNIGMRPNLYGGDTLRIIAGTGSGRTYPIASNTQTSVTISGSWITTPDATSLWTVEDTSPTASAQTQSVSTSSATQSGGGAITLTDLTPMPYRVDAFTTSGVGVTAFASDSPWREIYLFGPPQSLDTGLEGTPVSTTPPTDGQTLTYNSSTGQWEAAGEQIIFVDDETPGGTMDGVNAMFTLANSPNPADCLELYYNGDLLFDVIAYTLSGATVTLTSAVAPPNASQQDTLRAWYRY